MDATHAPAGQVWRFDTFRADLAARKLWNGERPVPLTPKVFHIFEHLLRNRDRIVSKKELFEVVWPDRVVEEANLTQSISVLRKALGETTATKYVATFPGMGYRFIAEAAEDRGEPPGEPAVRRRRSWWWGAAGTAVVAAGVVAGIWRFRSQPAPLVLGAPRAITHLPGREFQPVFSPDGRRVAFTYHGELNAPLGIGTVDVQERAELRMLPGGGGDMFSPAWSPDGQSLAYLHQRDGRLQVVIREANGETREVADVFPRSGLFERQLDWSPDGRLLAVTNKSADDEPFRIDLIHIRERRRTTLTVPPALSDGDFEPRFSPDGTRLAFIRQGARAVGEVLVIPLPSGDAAAATPRMAVGAVDWTPDSASLVVGATRAGTRGLWLLRPGAPEAEWRLVCRAAPDREQFSISRRTGQLVTASAEPDQNIWEARLSGAHATEGWDRLVESTGNDYFPVFSPDGRRFTFISERSGERQLWLKEGREERQLTFDRKRPSYASWTGDGEEVVYSSLDERTLYRLRVKGGQPVRIPVDGRVGSHTAVSPDGAWVFTVRRFYIYQSPATGGPERLLTDDGGYPLRLSPDGQWIYYAQHRFSKQIWRLNRTSGRAERLTDRLLAGCWACWAVSGQGLVYVAADPVTPTSIERLDLATGRVTVMGTLTGRLPPLGLGMLALAPDERSLLAVVSEAGVGDIEFVQQTPWTGSSPRL